MRNPASTRSPSPAASRWDLGVAIVSAAVAYGLFVLTCAMTVERLIAAAPPDIVAAVTGGLAP
jgi:hypothetical protein